jgi:DNA-binding transcriptional LysR family regulator
MKTIDLNALDVVVRVARAGSFTAAARAMGTSKQWVSRRVADAEAAVGLPLLERTTRTMKPTPAGARVIDRAEAALASITEALTEAESAQQEPSGQLRVSAPLLYGRRFLVPIIAEFREQNPKVLVELLLTDRRVSLMEEEIDVAIRVGASPDSSLLSRRLGQASLQLVASSAYLGRAGTPRTLAQLKTHHAVLGRADEAWTIDGASVQLEPSIVVAHLETRFEAACAGLGVALLPSFLVKPAVTVGQLVHLLRGLRLPTGQVQVLTHHQRSMPLRVRRFIDLVVQRAPDLS